MNIKIKKTLVALLSVLIVVFATVLNAFAYISDSTDKVVNTFILKASEESDIPTPPDPPKPPEPPNPPSTPDQTTPDQPTPDQVVQDVVLQITVNKIVDNLGDKTISPEGFEFKLTDSDTGESFVAITDEKGIAIFEFKFTAEDVGKTYNFSLCEVSGNIPGVVYSTEVYEFSVNIALDYHNKIVAECIMKDDDKNTGFTFSFTNIYDAPPTPGDFGNIIYYTIMAAMSLAGFVLLIYTKRSKI